MEQNNIMSYIIALDQDNMNHNCCLINPKVPVSKPEGKKQIDFGKMNFDFVHVVIQMLLKGIKNDGCQ